MPQTKEETNAKKRDYYRRNRRKILAQQAEWQRRNLQRILTKRKKDRRENPDKVHRRDRAAKLWTAYRLRVDEYEAAVKRHGGRCIICRRRTKLIVDHPHGVRIVRGFICNSCNAVIGFAEEDCGVLRRAIRYLEDWNRIMPVKRVQKDGKPGYRYGTKGKVYVYTPGNAASRAAAMNKAIKQALAIQRNSGVPADL